MEKVGRGHLEQGTEVRKPSQLEEIFDRFAKCNTDIEALNIRFRNGLDRAVGCQQEEADDLPETIPPAPAISRLNAAVDNYGEQIRRFAVNCEALDRIV